MNITTFPAREHAAGDSTELRSEPTRPPAGVVRIVPDAGLRREDSTANS